MEACTRDNLIFAGIVLALVLVLAIVSAFASKPRYSSAFESKVRELVRESVRWSTSAEEHTNPALALLHSAYGVGYLNVARSLASDREIEAITKTHRIDELADKIQNRQQKALGDVLVRCGTQGPVAIHTGYL